MDLESAERDALIVGSLQGTASPAELARLRAWRAASPEHERQYAAVRDVWALTGAPRARGARPAVPASVRHHLAARTRGVGRAAAATRRTVAWAAAVLACVVAGGVAWRRVGPGARPLASAVEAEYRPRGTETLTASLADGSVVRLAPHSRLRVLRTSPRRELVLHGRAFFAVARRHGAAFVVHTDGGTVESDGARFDVDAAPGVTRVVVVDGEVTVNAAGGRVSSGTGHVVRSAGSAVATDTVSDLARELTWMRGFLAFRDTPLRTVAREVGELYGVEVSVPDSIADRTVTAWFEQQTVDDVLSVVCRATYTRYELRDGVARIEAGGPPPPRSRSADGGGAGDR